MIAVNSQDNSADASLWFFWALQEYADATGDYIETWKDEIEEKYASIALLGESFQAEKALLTLDMQRRREDELKTKKVSY